MNDEHGPHCEGCRILGLMAERDAAVAMLSRFQQGSHTNGSGPDGTPEHLRMGLTKNGDGPVLSEDDPDFDHYGCRSGEAHHCDGQDHTNGSGA